MKVRMSFERRRNLADCPYHLIVEYMRKGEADIRRLNRLVPATFKADVNVLEFSHALRETARLLEEDCREEIAGR